MGANKNYSIIVASVIFAVFLVFVLFLAPKSESLTASVVVDFEDVAKDFDFGEVINGDLNITIKIGDFIKNDSIARLYLEHGTGIVVEKNMTANELFTKTTPNLVPQKKIAGWGFGVDGDYIVNLNVFELNTEPYYGKFDLIFEFEGKTEKKSIEIDDTTDKALIYGFNIGGFNIDEILEEVGDVEDEEALALVLSSIGTFYMDDTVLCVVYYDYSEATSLDIEFYHGTDLDKSFTDVTADLLTAVEVLDGDEGGICEYTDDAGEKFNYSVCGALYKVEDDKRGGWTCVATTHSTAGDIVAMSSNNFFWDDEFAMINSPPTLKKTIPNFNISVNGSYFGDESLDLDTYYYDKENDDMEFGVFTPKYINVKLDSSNKMYFGNHDNFQGVENVTVRVTDGRNISTSNYFLIKVGTGSYTPDGGDSGVCTPKWDFTEWGPCINNLKQRTVVDLNLCGDDTNKPISNMSCTATLSNLSSGQTYEDYSSPVSKAEGPGNIVWILLIVGVVIVIGGVIYYLATRNKKKNKPMGVNPNEVKFSSPIIGDTGQSRQKIETNINAGVVNIHELDAYISKSFAAGVVIDTIKTNLVDAGWDEKIVKERLAFASAKKFVMDKLAQGYDKENLRKSFLAKGWKESQIMELFE